MENIELKSIYQANLPDIKLKISKNTSDILAKFAGTYTIPHGCHVGIEYEIEHCEDTNGDNYGTVEREVVNHLWNITNDGSLRDVGLEFVSKPVAGDNIRTAIESLEFVLQHRYSRSRPSHRTGIHVHVNANDLNTSQLFGWMALYQVFERALYQFSGKREKNIYCLPTWAWSKNQDVALGMLYHTPRDAAIYMGTNSHKYAGMNTLPLFEKGTLEFRQMHTTKEFNKIGLWVEFLTKIKLYAANNVRDQKTLEEFYLHLSELNTSSEYTQLAMQVFGNNGQQLCIPGQWEKGAAEGVIQVKESYVRYLRGKAEKPKTKTKPPAPVDMDDEDAPPNPGVVFDPDPALFDLNGRYNPGRLAALRNAAVRTWATLSPGERNTVRNVLMMPPGTKLRRGAAAVYATTLIITF